MLNCMMTMTMTTMMLFSFSRTSRSRSKQDKKRFSLKEGSPHEEFALVEALRNLVEQTTSWKGLSVFYCFSLLARKYFSSSHHHPSQFHSFVFMLRTYFIIYF